MPEMPEVETVKNELAPYIIGRKIADVDLFWEGMVKNSSVADFRNRVIGKRITGLDRRGKYLFLEMSSGEVLVVHLRMSGSLLLSERSDGRFTRAAFHLDNGTKIYFRDPRKLGTMWLVEDENSVTGKLGPEPLAPDFTAEAMAQRLSNRSAPIKAVLCDQTVLAGVGNMYADEALFVAGIHPLKRANSLSKEEVLRLHRAVRQVLEEAIASSGASTRDYRRPSGEPGSAQYAFQVAHRGGQPCPVCSTLIQRIPIRNRGTYFCPRCQEGSGL